MSQQLFNLYHFPYANGSSKDWAYSDLGDGKAEIRWGPKNRLYQRQIKPLSETLKRAHQKETKGYFDMGMIFLDEKGNRISACCGN